LWTRRHADCCVVDVIAVFQQLRELGKRDIHPSVR
jgi:hypothetical protein